MSAAIVPSGIGLGVMLMPTNPAPPFTAVNVARYAPGGGSNLVGEEGDEQPPASIAHQANGSAVSRIPSRSKLAQADGYFIRAISMVTPLTPRGAGRPPWRSRRDVCQGVNHWAEFCDWLSEAL